MSGKHNQLKCAFLYYRSKTHEANLTELNIKIVKFTLTVGDFYHPSLSNC